MPDKRSVDDLSIEELEAVVRRRKRELKEERLRRLRENGRARGDLPLPADPALSAERLRALAAPPPRRRIWMNRALLGVEVLALLGFVYVIYLLVGAVRTANQEFATPVAPPPSQASALIDVVLLPDGHTPPNAAGESSPNEAGGVPDHLKSQVAAITPLPIPTAGPEQARLIEIPAIGVRAQAVEGDGWEQLKLGIGHHAATANPGQRGNMVMTAHNDVFGQIFRDLHKLRKGDLIYVDTASQRYTYVVAADPRIVPPTEVSVMLPTRDATLTFITCYPYLVDNQRVIVAATLKP